MSVSTLSPLISIRLKRRAITRLWIWNGISAVVFATRRRLSGFFLGLYCDPIFAAKSRMESKIPKKLNIAAERFSAGERMKSNCASSHLQVEIKVLAAYVRRSAPLTRALGVFMRLGGVGIGARARWRERKSTACCSAGLGGPKARWSTRARRSPTVMFPRSDASGDAGRRAWQRCRGKRLSSCSIGGTAGQ